MTGYGLLFDYLWVAPHVLLVLVAAIMVRRKLVREFPAFFAYVVSEIVQFCVLVNHRVWDDDTYTRIYFIGALISCLLRFAVMYEIFKHIFRDYPALQGLGRRAYRWSAAALVLISVAVIATSSSRATTITSTWIYVVGRAVTIIQCGLLLVLFAMSRFLRFSWRNHAFGIALGLGLFASVDLAAAAVRAEMGTAAFELFAFTLFNYITMTTYHVCVLLWAVYLWLPDREPLTQLRSVPLNALENWDHALQKVLER